MQRKQSTAQDREGRHNYTYDMVCRTSCFPLSTFSDAPQVLAKRVPCEDIWRDTPLASFNVSPREPRFGRSAFQIQVLKNLNLKGRSPLGDGDSSTTTEVGIETVSVSIVRY